MLRTQAESTNDEIAAWFEKEDINNESDSLLMYYVEFNVANNRNNRH